MNNVKNRWKANQIAVFILILCGTAWPVYSQKTHSPPTELFAENLFHITEVMVTDVASPPAAARFYAYSTLAAHLAWDQANGLTGIENLLTKTNIEKFEFIKETERNLSPEFVSVYAMLETGKNIMPSGKLLEEKQKALTSQFFKSRWVSKKEIEGNIEFAKKVSAQVLKLANNDGYKQLSALTRYSPKKSEGHWYPTPPAYMAAVEPEWRTIRTFFLKDLKSFKPLPPAKFDLSEGSPFKKQLDEVYQVTSSLSEEQQLIANFWDCNPFKVSFSGHMAIGLKKISPGGHWIGITGIAAEKAKLPWRETIFIHTLVALGLHDAFVSCWEEKYDSDRIRPESAIQKHIKSSWRPLLQTPPFPEYTSGHSVISKTSAVILTSYFGENFDFVDTSEVYFGLPERPFQSFYQAADEAAISRLYGGIHFRDAIEEGVKQGDKIGHYIVKKTDLKQVAGR
ncbi:vanadium-dependent haloperoxidase [Aquiflexum sp. LQ15W]|uniref:vanadium-dependent haloperoxidase n=1 Tax=Cognataquiflexum nitidum TaxID=2922272 RepID=UPI001F13BD8E|nr:vanadium-dependent haloperoxidase [Cognataquiflexum nitidum]MCH6199922.1 vanadium-dependent haloperoxidase [Cognataquiflexum nitidum]